MSLENIKFDVEDIESKLSAQAEMKTMVKKVREIAEDGNKLSMFMSYNSDAGNFSLNMLGEPDPDKNDNLAEDMEAGHMLTVHMFSIIGHMVKSLLDSDSKTLSSKLKAIEMLVEAFDELNEEDGKNED